MTSKAQFLTDNHQKIIQLAQKFVSYPAGITQHSIESFLKQFKAKDISLGLKLLRSVDYYDPPRMINLSRDLGNIVFALNNNSFDDVLFCPMSSTSGNSADAIKRLLRMSMTGRSSPGLTDDHFLNSVLDLSEEKFTDDTNPKKIVFIDHFIGSGNSIISVWGAIQQWENENYDYYVGTLVGYDDSITYIETETAHHLNVFSVVTVLERSRAFNENNIIFTNEEKEILKKYCENLGLDPNDQYGFMNSQSLIVFSNRISDNVLPILYHRTEKWIPLFPREF